MHSGLQVIDPMCGKLIAFWLIFVLFASMVAESAVLRVPQDYSTIQSAIDSSAAGDSVRIDSGLYIESLVIPAHDLSLMGRFVETQDSTDIFSTIVLAPDTGMQRTCVTAPSSDTLRSLRMMGLSFRGGVFGDTIARGGLNISDRLFSLEFCVVESSYAVFGGALDARRSTVNIQDCRLRHTGASWLGEMIYSEYSDVSLTRTEIAYNQGHSHHEPADILAIRERTLSLRDCFVHNLGFSYMLGDEFIDPVVRITSAEVSGCRIENCRFHHFFSMIETGSSLLRLDSCTVTGCLFQDCIFVSTLANLPTLRASGNLFYANFSFIAGGVTGGFFNITGWAQTVTITHNLFLENFAQQYSCLFLEDSRSAQVDISRNYFVRNSNESVESYPGGACIIRNNLPGQFRENLFVDNYNYAVFHGSSEDPVGFVENCYWGHPSGPWHPTLNPTALGDSVDEEIDPFPFESDTSFLSAPTRREVTTETDFLIGFAFPNPFNSEITIEFVTTKEANVRLTVYDLLGREVSTLLDGAKPIGIHRAKWSPSSAASGIYFARLESPDSHQPPWLHKLVLLK